jgi:ADP-ribose pyrophosphatase YjhB (NUDIX family)
MKLTSTYNSKSSGIIPQTYYDEEDIVGVLDEMGVHGSHAICFLGDKLVLVNDIGHGWGPPGGTTEIGETYYQTTEREVLEETNMKVLYQELVGLAVFERPEKTIRQTRVMCIVEKVGEFVSDPGGEILGTKLIDPKDYKQYFDWGEVGDRVMQRAIELKDKWESKSI